MFPALGNVCVERKCFVRREKLWGEERRGEDCDSSKVRNNGLLKRVSKIFFFSRISSRISQGGRVSSSFEKCSLWLDSRFVFQLPR